MHCLDMRQTTNQLGKSSLANIPTLDAYESAQVEVGRGTLSRLYRRYGWLRRIRPQILADPLYKLVSPHDRRAIVVFKGAQLYIDPFSRIGATLLEHGEYEPSICDLLRTVLRPGSTFF